MVKRYRKGVGWAIQIPSYKFDRFSVFLLGAAAPQTPRYDLSGTPNAKQGFGWGKLEIN